MWWWWWILFIVIFFFLPLGYGWGYRGWGPWYRRRPPTDLANESVPPEVDTGWGWIAFFLWIVLILAIIWLVAGWWGWGGWWAMHPPR
jgi:hypothetical protein